MIAILRKELTDYFNSARFFVLFLLVLLSSGFGVWVALQGIRQTLVETGAVTGKGFVFLALFASSGEGVFTLVFFIMVLVPIIGIALGFDAINSERCGGTLSRLLSQPVYRDSVINGKFLAGIITLAIMVATTLLLVSGYGLRAIGVPPTAEEIIRLFIYFALTIVYGAFWMGLSILFSVVFRRIAVSLLIMLAIWLFFFFFWTMIGSAIASAVAPTIEGTQAVLIRNAEMQQMLLRFSPIFLFQEATTVLLLPVWKGLGVMTYNQAA